MGFTEALKELQTAQVSLQLWPKEIVLVETCLLGHFPFLVAVVFATLPTTVNHSASCPARNRTDASS